MSSRFIAAALIVTSFAAAQQGSACEPRVRYSGYYTTAAQVSYVYSKPAPTVAVVPAAVHAEVFQVPAGGTVTVSHNFLGTQPGFVLLHTGDAVLKCEVLGWESTKATFRMPEMGIKQPTAGRFEVILPTGQVALSQTVQLVSPPKFFVHDTPSAPAPALISSLGSIGNQAQTAGLALKAEGTVSVRAGISN